ncbi:hypothetical protein BZA70DRAFT_271569 [Myxozyma melibiosi]|uniref:Alpha-ketoglutarate-dependent dioxygenase AlkB-like domain-containing protein n=1 Tax=Myxozyma melibiosi TaxID=54550 RepID=A0ABR1FCF9_9ASCO
MDAPANNENAFKPLYKFYKHLPYEAFDEYAFRPSSAPETANLIDPLFLDEYEELHPGDVTVSSFLYTQETVDALGAFIYDSKSQVGVGSVSSYLDSTYSEIRVASVPGLRIYPGILLPDLQRQLIVNVIEEYLPPKDHLTNLHPSYTIPEPFNLFGYPSDLKIMPSQTSSTPAQTPTTLDALQSRKLRWVTLGGQYNWTTKQYPSWEPHTKGFPDFPHSLTTLLRGLSSSIFKSSLVPEASIINFYSDGDILSPHQDVAEKSHADLASLSIGCEAVFFCGLDKSKPPLQIRVRSGDIILMGGESRFAYHGVGRVWDRTAPDYLTEFDYTNNILPSNPKTCAAPEVCRGRENYSEWILSKRINLNIRQMLD